MKILRSHRPGPLAYPLLAVALLSLGPCDPGEDGSTADGARWPTPAAVGSHTFVPTPVPTTAPIHFIALGDTGTGLPGQWEVAAAIAAKCAGAPCDFGILLGDNFYPSGVTSTTDAKWQSLFEEPYGGLGFPFYATLGNHDYGNDGNGDVFSLGEHQVAYGLDHPNWILPAEWYAFDRGAADFFATGSNLVIWDHENAREVQTGYFSDAIAESTRPWKIALMHHPYLSNGAHGNAGRFDGKPDPISSGAYYQQFVEETLCGKVDLYLSGHDHNLQVLPGTETCPGLFVVSGSGAFGTLLLGTNLSLWQSSAAGFAYISVTETALTVEMIEAATGTAAFRTSVTR